MKKQERGKDTGIYQEIPIDKIITEGQSVREAQDDDHVVELAMSIAKHGLLEPIVVRKMEDGNYQLLAGFHRLAAMTRLKRKTITAHVLDENQAPVKAIALIENIVRKDMTLKEEVEAVTYLNQEEGLSTSSICELLGKSRDWVDKRLMIPHLPKDIMDELLDGRISIKHAEILGQIEDPATRKSITVSTIQNKLSTRDVQELAKLYMAPYNIEDAVETGLEKIEEQRRAPTPTRQCAVCGQHKPLSEITWVPVCLYGCEPADGKKEEKQTIQ
jgi:ParB family chromosome partitioning protein